MSKPSTPFMFSDTEIQSLLQDDVNVDSNFIEDFNSIFSDKEMRQLYKENILGFKSILYGTNVGGKKIPLEKYLYAVKYCSYKQAGLVDKEAFELTFPGKLLELSYSTIHKDVEEYTVSAYNNSKIVQGILQQSLIPIWLTNRDVQQKAINTLEDLMDNDESSRIRMECATSLLHHLKQPESAKLEVDIKVANDTSAIDALNHALTHLAEGQLDTLTNKSQTLKDVGASPLHIIEGEAVE